MHLPHRELGVVRLRVPAMGSSTQGPVDTALGTAEPTPTLLEWLQGGRQGVGLVGKQHLDCSA